MVLFSDLGMGTHMNQSLMIRARLLPVSYRHTGAKYQHQHPGVP